MDGFLTALYVFVLALFAGYELINRVPSLLHTPLMSGSNALSGITIIGSLILAGQENVPELVHILAGVAVCFATINVVGGFVVTHRMLGMFRKKG